METSQNERLTELRALFDGLFPNGFAGPDVLAELAPEGWPQSPLLACFHPSVERVFEEQLQMHGNLEGLLGGRGDQGVASRRAPRPAPTVDDVRREYRPQPVRQDEELIELIGQCLWDVFSDNHDVIMSSGRTADIGSFRGASAFLDEYASGDAARRGDHMRFYMGTIWISGRADLTPVYVMIFRRLEALGADWVYHHPELYLVELGPQRRDAEAKRLHGVVADANARARDEAMDRLPPPTVDAYRRVYGVDPQGWPPA
jgi:hypothetical protein